MSVKNKTNKNDKRSQKGRSMVEMLGVLAIVGVLSVGGVYGYGIAMKKHKANELLHQASMLATTISAQAMTNDGKLPETITSFGNSSYGNFSPSVSDALNGKGFSITIENVDSAVCDQLKEGGMVQKVECNETAKTATLTYYKNLATTEAEGEKSPTGGETVECNPPCQEGEECFSGFCQKVSHGSCEEYEDFCCLPTNLSPSLEVTPCGTNCDKEDESCPTNTFVCTKNSDCLGKEILGSVCQSGDCYCAFFDVLEDGTPYFGQCVPFTDYEKQKKISETDFYSYWSAVNFCKALGKTLPSRPSNCNETDTTGCIKVDDVPFYWFSTKPSDGKCETYGVSGFEKTHGCSEMMANAFCV